MSLSLTRRVAASARSPLNVAGWLALAPATLLLIGALLPPAARAHHLLSLLDLAPTPLTGLLSGLAHPVIGPDHLLFLLALALVGLGQRRRWLLSLLVTGLLGSVLGLLWPGLSGGEALVALTLVAVALVLLGRLPRAALLPAFALHGYVLSAPVLGWSTAPLSFYLVGLLLSQGTLLLLSLTLLRRLGSRLSPAVHQGLACGLIGIGLAWSWSALVA